jgi:diguanylate cyclase (GGDEF)-like protein
VILRDTSAEGAQQVARKIRRKISQLNIPRSGSQVAAHVTISLGGAACYPREGLTVEHLIREADAALYAAKNSGRNRAVIHHAGAEISGKECPT